MAAGLMLMPLLALPAGASASTKQSTTITAPGQVAVLTPTCPSGRRATGGGFVTPPHTASTKYFVDESRKVGQRSWRVTAQEFLAAAPAVITAYVYCSENAPKTKEKSASITSPAAGVINSTDARCGNAGKAQAGGFLVQDQPVGYALASESFRSSKASWRTRGFGVAGHAITSYVYCADAGSPKARLGSTSTATTGLFTAVSAPCKHGTHVGAGGFSQPSAPDSGRFQYPYEFFRTGRTWRASAEYANSTTAATTLNAIAYCV